MKKEMLSKIKKEMPKKKGAMPEFDVSEMEIELGREEPSEEGPEEEMPEMEMQDVEEGPLAEVSDEDLLAEMKKRGLQQGAGEAEEEGDFEVAQPVPMAKKKAPKEEEYA